MKRFVKCLPDRSMIDSQKSRTKRADTSDLHKDVPNVAPYKALQPRLISYHHQLCCAAFCHCFPRGSSHSPATCALYKFLQWHWRVGAAALPSQQLCNGLYVSNVVQLRVPMRTTSTSNLQQETYFDKQNCRVNKSVLYSLVCVRARFLYTEMARGVAIFILSNRLTKLWNLRILLPSCCPSQLDPGNCSYLLSTRWADRRSHQCKRALNCLQSSRAACTKYVTRDMFGEEVKSRLSLPVALYRNSEIVT